MTITKEDPEIAVNADNLPVVTAVGIEEKADEKVPSAGGNQGPPIPAGHARFFCNKCRAIYYRGCFWRICWELIDFAAGNNIKAFQ
eukprot:scaffold1277_cov137-Skeletonema_menzelii.AAC.9